MWNKIFTVGKKLTLSSVDTGKRWRALSAGETRLSLVSGANRMVLNFSDKHRH